VPTQYHPRHSANQAAFNRYCLSFNLQGAASVKVPCSSDQFPSFNANPIVPFPVFRFYDGLLLTLVFLEEVLGWGYGLSRGLDQKFMGEAFVARPLKIISVVKWRGIPSKRVSSMKSL
jgi:hypothetical protein